MTNHQRCLSRVKWFGDVYPCDLKPKHKGKHKYVVMWNDREARLSGGIDSKGKMNE